MDDVLICTVCPKGCKMEIYKSNLEIYNISGYGCEKGKKYAEQEVINPSRILTTTVKIKNGHINRLPVRSEGTISKNQMIKCIGVIREAEVEAPIKQGDVIIENILGSGINIIASKSILKNIK
ncbi:MAG: DUF1667 domain-containing protein [Bacillota bacterium]|nr:DUF1667 domain-containing protein [Bacillota bacterium]